MHSSPIIFRLTTFDQLSQDEWDALFLASRTGNLFYHRAFLQAAKAAWPEKQPDGFVAGYRNERLVLLQPYKIKAGVLGRVVEILRIPTADGIEPILVADDHGAILRALLEYIRNTLKPDLLLAHSLTRTFHAALSDYFSGFAVRQGERQRGYYLDLPESVDAFWASYKSNFRSQLRKKIKTAENAGLVFRIVEANQLPAGYDMQQAIEHHTRLHKMRFDSMNRASFFVQPDFQVFHRHLCAHAAGPSCELTFTEALHEGKVVGSLYGARAPHAYIYLMIGFDPAYAAFSLGNLMLYYTIENLIGHQVSLFDFKCGEESYKERWATGTYEKFNVYVAFNAKGELLYLRQFAHQLQNKLSRAPRKLKRMLQARLSPPRIIHQ